MERPDIFADAINYAVYQGKQIVKAESLEDASTVATSFVCNGNNSAVTFERIRDVRKVVKLNTEDRTAYMIYGAENQSHIHYAMPVKNMLYDVMEYADQIDTRRKKIKAKEYDEYGDSNLGIVLSFIKNSVDKEKVSEKFSDTELDAESVMVINSCTGTNIPLPQKGETIKMCKAWEDFKKEGIIEGQNEVIEAMRANGASEELIQATLKTRPRTDI